MINLKTQTQVQQPNVLPQSGKANPEAPSSKSRIEQLEKNVNLVKEGKLPPDEALKDIGVSNAKVTQNGKNATLTFDINGKQVTVTGSSPEEIAKNAADIVADESGEELGKASDEYNGSQKALFPLIFVFALFISIGLTLTT